MISCIESRGTAKIVRRNKFKVEIPNVKFQFLITNILLVLFLAVE